MLAIVGLAPRLARWRWLERGEAALAARIVRWHRPRTLAMFEDVSALGSSTLVALLATLLVAAFWLRGETASALALALAAGSAGPLGTLLKRMTGRTRPNEPAGAYFGSSLPSNHTLMASALYGTLALELNLLMAPDDPLRVLVAVATLAAIGAIGAARVLLRVHHPSDVVAAWLLGAAIVAAVAQRPWAC